MLLFYIIEKKNKIMNLIIYKYQIKYYFYIKYEKAGEGNKKAEDP